MRLHYPNSCMVNRIRTQFWNAFTLNADFYRDIADDATTRRCSRSIVLLTAISYGVGNAVILGMTRSAPLIIILGFGIAIVLIVASYYFWTLTIHKFLQWITARSLSYPALLNLVGFAYAPQLFTIFTLIPLLGRPIELALNVWSLFAVMVAVRHKLNIELPIVVLVCLPGWLLSNVGTGIIQVLNQR